MEKEFFTFSIDIKCDKGDGEYTYNQLCVAINNACDYLIADITINKLEPLELDQDTL